MKKLLLLLSFGFILSSSASSISSATVLNLEHKLNNNQVDKQVNTISDISAMAVNHNNGDIYLANNFLYKSTDGLNFTKIDTNLPSGIAISNLTISKNGDIYLISQFGLYYGNIQNYQFTKIDYQNNIFNQIPDNGLVTKLFCWKTDLYALVNNTLYTLQKYTNIFYFVRVLNVTNIINFTVAKNGDVYLLVNNLMSLTLVLLSNSNSSFTIVNSWNNKNISNIFFSNGSLYIINNQNQFLQSTDDGKNFSLFSTVQNPIDQFIVANNIIYYTDQNKNMHVTNSFNKLISINNQNNFNSANNTFTFKSLLNFTVNSNYVACANFNNTNISDFTKPLNLNSGVNKLVINLKPQYYQNANLFNGNSATGQVVYNFNVNNQLAKTDVAYTTANTLYNDLTSTLGNTQGATIIQTKDNLINVNINNISLNFDKSYYVQGTVSATNDFSVTSNKTYLNTINKNQFSISGNGIYHLFLLDQNNNIYNSYLEFGQDNWLLKGNFNNNQTNIASLASQLNVNLDISDPSNTQIILNTLTALKTSADNFFANFLEAKFPNLKGKLTLDKLLHGYKSLLDPINYSVLKKQTFNDQFNDFNLIKFNTLFMSNNYSQIQFQANMTSKMYGLTSVDTKNVTNELLLQQYTLWAQNFVNFYVTFMTNWKNYMFNSVSQLTRGYGSDNQLFNITKIINSLFIAKNKLFSSVSLEKLTWTSNMNSDNYNQLTNFSALNVLTKVIINKQAPNLLNAYSEDLQKAESNLNLHGYSISELLANDQLPQNKSQVEQNYNNSGLSFHQWLQTQANNKYSKWQLQLGLEIAIPLLIFIMVSFIIYVYYYNQKYGAAGMRRKLKPRKIKYSN